MPIAYKPEELERIDEIIKRNDIRFIRLQFSDIVGVSKQITISAQERCSPSFLNQHLLPIPW